MSSSTPLIAAQNRHVEALALIEQASRQMKAMHEQARAELADLQARVNRLCITFGVASAVSSSAICSAAAVTVARLPQMRPLALDSRQESGALRLKTAMAQLQEELNNERRRQVSSSDDGEVTGVLHAEGNEQDDEDFSKPFIIIVTPP